MYNDEFWQKFLFETNLDKNIKCADCFSFGLNKHSANKLLKLVLRGEKQATQAV